MPPYVTYSAQQAVLNKAGIQKVGTKQMNVL